MIYKSGSSYSCVFLTTNPVTGASQDADSLPTALAMRNGSDDVEFSLTVTNVAVGRYRITGTIPSYDIGDRVDIVVTATVDGITSRGLVDSFRIDSQFVSDVIVGINSLTNKVDAIPTNPLLANDTRLANLNLISQIPDLTAIEVWEYSNRTLSNMGNVPNIIDMFFIVVGANQQSVRLYYNEDGTVDMVAKQGTSWNIFVTVKTDQNTPMPLYNYTFRGQMRTSYDSPEVALEFGYGIINAEAGQVVFTATASDTAAVKPYRTSVPLDYKLCRGVGTYVYDFEIVDANNPNNVARLMEGRVVVDPEVTK